ncbi:PREDICTED: interleukin-2 receptor subunit beta [Elephantulus edwardii]|uniref:interleukin-2 receptor subunit beta n=1 Tax=Elephantulus edwardii TaxID=28737 RepID=UPI0003F0CA33|nr:PREDICTED: interleukin-2 receptor subunit beta [Elephantulus edwardii]
MAAPPHSWYLAFLNLLLPLAISWAATAENGTSLLSCFYNSRANISCVWSQHGALPGVVCQVYAKSDKRTWNKTCKLLPTSLGSWACNLILGDYDSQKLTASDNVNISMVCQEGEKRRLVTSQDFKPFENLRLMAPNSLQVVHVEAHRCNVTWILPQASHYLEHYLEFEARFRLSDHSWEGSSMLSIKQNQWWLVLETLTPDTAYELQVRATARRGQNTTWSPWSQPLPFRTKPGGMGKSSPFSWLGHTIVALSGAIAFAILVYLLANCRYIEPWLKEVLKCHIPDPSEFFSKLSSEHGGDFKKWLSSPFPSSSFSPSGPAPEISPLEVLDRDTKATQLLLQSQDKEPVSSPSSHSQTSCFTNQGYFFFHLPDALEIEACQVYFTYDPCAEEPDEGRPGAPAGSPVPALPPPPGDDDAYCTFPPGDDQLFFSPSLHAGPAPQNMALRGSGARPERLPSFPQEAVSGDSDSRPLDPPTLEVPSPVADQSLQLEMDKTGQEVSMAKKFSSVAQELHTRPTDWQLHEEHKLSLLSSAGSAPTSGVGTRGHSQAGLSPGNRSRGTAQISHTCLPASEVPKGWSQAGTACLLPVYLGSATGPSRTQLEAHGARGHRPQGTRARQPDHGAGPLIEPRLAGLGVGRPWPGQTEAPEADVQARHPPAIPRGVCVQGTIPPSCNTNTYTSGFIAGGEVCVGSREVSQRPGSLVTFLLYLFPIRVLLTPQRGRA